MIYPDIDCQERTDCDYKRHYGKGTDASHYKGVKSHVKIARIINVPNSVPLDYMHLVLLGLLRNYAKHFFNSSNSDKNYYIGIKIL